MSRCYELAHASVQAMETDKPALNRQTVFYTKDVIPVKSGEEIVGTLTCAPNQRNNRDLDINIKYESKGERPVSDEIQYKMCVF